MNRWTLLRAFMGCPLSLLLTVAVGCSSVQDGSREILPGQTRDEVTAALGNPDEIVDFLLPDEPFFGPQESLASILAPGTLVEEWQYQIEGEVTYIWFAGEAAEPREEWKVIDIATYPQGAVY